MAPRGPPDPGWLPTYLFIQTLAIRGAGAVVWSLVLSIRVRERGGGRTRRVCSIPANGFCQTLSPQLKLFTWQFVLFSETPRWMDYFFYNKSTPKWIVTVNSSFTTFSLQHCSSLTTTPFSAWWWLSFFQSLWKFKLERILQLLEDSHLQEDLSPSHIYIQK